MSEKPRSAAAEWRKHWVLVLASCIGMSLAAVPMQSMSFFMDPIRDEFGWSRTQVSIGLSAFSLVVIPLAPFAGAIQDWLGPRRVAIIGVVLCTAALISLAFSTGSIELWVGQWSFYAIVQMLIKTTVWIAAISSVFVYGRGLAIAIVLCGITISEVFVPILSHFLIEAFGWRQAYILLGASWGGTVLLFVVLFFYDRQAKERAEAKRSAAPAIAATGEALDGLTMREALRSIPLYRITFALMISSAISMAVVTHRVSFLGEMGVSRGEAATLAASMGITGLFGKLFTGWLYDRAHASLVGVVSFLLVAAGFALLLEPLRSPTAIVIAFLLFGYGLGAKLQVGSYLTALYIGQRNFGKIFGVRTSLVAMGLGSGPILGGAIHDYFGSYQALFIVGIPVYVLCGLLVWGLGGPPDAQRTDADKPKPGAAAVSPAVQPT